ncbi:MAG: tRNA pseudouridine(38-40) synthase TruA [Lachnospiraceae bacterium]|nr:tRNA pseudouridine(38-40) synthase TruA [Lachnospiraceae bacterium]
MKRIRLTIAYDGTAYCGWQMQDGAATVEGAVKEALEQLLGEPVEVAGASRTDAGVHAMGNVAVFDTETKIPPEKIALAVNRYLPEDIRVQKSEEVAPDFHPRYCDSTKTYEYTITNTPIPIPTLRRYSHHVYGVLKVDAMQEAAGIFTGTHDFSAFCAAGSQVKSKVRTIYDVRVEEIPLPLEMQGSQIRIRVSGSGFLYNMVRILVGTLLEVGRGRRTAASVEEALQSGERSQAGPTAPACGLMLVGIEYGENDGTDKEQGKV